MSFTNTEPDQKEKGLHPETRTKKRGDPSKAHFKK